MLGKGFIGVDCIGMISCFSSYEMLNRRRRNHSNGVASSFSLNDLERIDADGLASDQHNVSYKPFQTEKQWHFDESRYEQCLFRVSACVISKLLNLMQTEAGSPS